MAPQHRIGGNQDHWFAHVETTLSQIFIPNQSWQTRPVLQVQIAFALEAHRRRRRHWHCRRRDVRLRARSVTTLRTVSLTCSAWTYCDARPGSRRHRSVGSQSERSGDSETKKSHAERMANGKSRNLHEYTNSHILLNAELDTYEMRFLTLNAMTLSHSFHTVSA